MAIQQNIQKKQKLNTRSKPGNRPKISKSSKEGEQSKSAVAAEKKPLKSAMKKPKSTEVIDMQEELKKQQDFVSIGQPEDQEEFEEKEDQVDGRELFDLDSSDEEGPAEQEHTAQDISRNLPQPPAIVPAPSEEVTEEPAKKKKKRNKKSAEVKKEPASPTTLYISRLPHGFYEHQLMSYFRQFGPIIRLKMPRSRQTNGSKAYAFIEFKYADTARIAQETMDGYLLFGRVLKCKVLPALSGDAVELDLKLQRMWSGCVRPGQAVRAFTKPVERAIKRKIEVQESVKEQDPSVVNAKLKKNLEMKENKLKRKLAKVGVDYDFDGYSNQVALIK